MHDMQAVFFLVSSITFIRLNLLLSSHHPSVLVRVNLTIQYALHPTFLIIWFIYCNICPPPLLSSSSTKLLYYMVHLFWGPSVYAWLTCYPVAFHVGWYEDSDPSRLFLNVPGFSVSASIQRFPVAKYFTPLFSVHAPAVDD